MTAIVQVPWYPPLGSCRKTAADLGPRGLAAAWLRTFDAYTRACDAMDEAHMLGARNIADRFYSRATRLHHLCERLWSIIEQRESTAPYRVRVLSAGAVQDGKVTHRWPSFGQDWR